MNDRNGDDRNRLVFGDDGSEAADVAWLWLNEHPWPGWRIDIVTADFDVRRPISPDTADARLRPWRPPAPRQLLAGSGATEVRHLLTRTDPRLMLSEITDARLMVIGHRGRGVLKAMSIGSTAEWLLHQPPVPLLIVRSGRPARRIMLCVDGSADARAVTRSLAAMPWIAGRQVLVLSVEDDRTKPRPAIAEAVAVLEEAGALPRPCRRESLRHSVAFDARSTILEALEQDTPDLVAVGTRGVGLGRRLLQGSTATAVAHHAPCSVLVARAGSPSDTDHP